MPTWQEDPEFDSQYQSKKKERRKEGRKQASCLGNNNKQGPFLEVLENYNTDQKKQIRTAVYWKFKLTGKPYKEPFIFPIICKSGGWIIIHQSIWKKQLQILWEIKLNILFLQKKYFKKEQWPYVRENFILPELWVSVNSLPGNCYQRAECSVPFNPSESVLSPNRETRF